MIKNHPLISEEELITIVRSNEEKFTVEEILSWINITLEFCNADKILNKNLITSLNSYKQELNNMLAKSQTLRRTSVAQAYKLLNIEWKYK